MPLLDPRFGDAGRVDDPRVRLGHLAAVTERIAPSAAGIVLPPHTAEAAASVDALWGGRFALGAASGDRGPRHRAAPRRPRRGRPEDGEAAHRTTREGFPHLSGAFGETRAPDLPPKPPAGHLRMLAVGGGRQGAQWIARAMEGRATHPRPLPEQRGGSAPRRTAVARRAPGLSRPFARSLFVDRPADPDAPPTDVVLGFRAGRNRLVEHLGAPRAMGEHHAALSRRPAAEVPDELGREVLTLPASRDGAGG